MSVGLPFSSLLGVRCLVLTLSVVIDCWLRCLLSIGVVNSVGVSTLICKQLFVAGCFLFRYLVGVICLERS